MSPENSRPLFDQESHENESIPIVGRAILVSPVSLHDLEEQWKEAQVLLETGGSPEEFTFSSVILCQKGDKGPSKGLVAPLGGELHEDEENGIGLQRAVAEKTTVIGQNAVQSLRDWNYQDRTIQDFTYSFKNNDKLEFRTAYVRVLPILSSDISRHEDKRISKDNIIELISITPIAFRELLSTGKIYSSGRDYRMLEHMVLSNTDIFPKATDHASRDQALGEVISNLENYETILKHETLSQANALRKRDNLPPVDSVISLPIKDLRRGFIAAQLNIVLSDARFRDNFNKQEDDIVITKPPRHTDLLVICKYLDLLPVTDALRVLETLRTEAVAPTVDALRSSFTAAVYLLLQNVDHYIAVQEDRPYRNLTKLWPILLELPEHKRNKLFDRANAIFVDTFCMLKGIPVHALQQALDAASGIPEYISENLSKIHQEYQLHKELNVVANANFFTLMLLANGFEPNRQLTEDIDDETIRLVRWEAYRKIALMDAGLTGIKMINDADNSMFETLLDSYLDRPKRDHLDLPDGTSFPIERQQTFGEVDFHKLDIIVDERQRKSLESLIRKLLQEDETEIFDINALNFVIADSNFSEKARIEDHLVKAFFLRYNLLRFIEEKLKGTGWEVWYSELEDDLNKVYNNILIFATLQSQEERDAFVENLKTGKRSGSMGDLIIRDQFRIRLVKEGVEHSCEICIYPFEQVNSPKAPESIRNSGFWGFVEKIFDNKNGLYEARRISLRNSKKRPLEPTLIELLYLANIYDKLHEHHRDTLMPIREKNIPSTWIDDN